MIGAAALLAAWHDPMIDPSALGRPRAVTEPRTAPPSTGNCPQTLTSFRGDYETGTLSQWELLDARSYPAQPLYSGARVVQSPVRQGSYAAAFDVRSAQTDSTHAERAEVTKCIGDTEGTDAWYAFATYFPATFSTPSWAVLHQWQPHKFPTPPFDCVQNNIYVTRTVRSDPATAVIEMRIRGGSVGGGIVGDTTCPRDNYRRILSHVTLGQWNEFVVHFRWSSDSATGRIDIWWRLEGDTWHRIPNPVTGDTTFYTGANLLRYWNGTAWEGATVAIREGVYRWANATPATVYHDGYVRDTSFAAVVAAAFPARMSPQTR
jgi:hypothetical protein